MVALAFAGTSGMTWFTTSPEEGRPEGVVLSASDRDGEVAGDALDKPCFSLLALSLECPASGVAGIRSPCSRAVGCSNVLEEAPRTLWRRLIRLGPTTIAARSRPAAAAGTMYRRLATGRGGLSCRCS